MKKQNGGLVPPELLKMSDSFRELGHQQMLEDGVTVTMPIKTYQYLMKRKELDDVSEERVAEIEKNYKGSILHDLELYHERGELPAEWLEFFKSKVI